MSQVILAGFGGIAPKVSPRMLKENLAVEARNARVDRGRLEPFREFAPVGTATSAAVQTIYPYQGQWLTWNERVSVQRSPVVNDTLERIYYTDGSYPKVRSGSSVFRLGLPRPPAPSIGTVDAGDTTSLSGTRNQSYVVTWVDAWGAEGPPSLPTSSVEVGVGGSVDLGLPSVPSGDYNFGAGALIRIYRSNSGSTGRLFQYVTEVPVGTASLTDDLEPGDLQEALPSDTWLPPPDDDTALYPDGPLQGLASLPNGALVGYSGKTLCFTPPGLPHAWPMEYRYATDAPIVGIAVTQQGVAVMTEDKPYVAIGTNPAAIVMQHLDHISQPCVSPDSIVPMSGGCIYASPDGLVGISGSSGRVMTEEIFDRTSWQAFLDPTTIRAWEHEGLIIGTHSGGGFMYDPASSVFIELDIDAHAGYRDTALDTLYLSHDNGTSWEIAAFDRHLTNFIPYVWQSKEFVLPTPESLTVARAQAGSYPVQFDVYGDGQLLFNGVLDDAEPCRVPGDYRARSWQVRLHGTASVEMLGLWESMGGVR